MSRLNQKPSLPRFGSSLTFGEAGTVTPFYVEYGFAKSGHSVRGDWISENLSPIQLAQITKQGFPLKDVFVFRIDVLTHNNPVHLIFLEKENTRTLSFWTALAFLCTGAFLSKYVFLRGDQVSSLSGIEQDTLKHLQAFFSHETNYGEEVCNMLFDADRKVLIVLGEIGSEFLDVSYNISFPEHNYPDLRHMVNSLL